jgi:hypothetical protein
MSAKQLSLPHQRTCGGRSKAKLDNSNGMRRFDIRNGDGDAVSRAAAPGFTAQFEDCLLKKSEGK